MEKFSGFNDPMTGINPFIAPRIPKITFLTVLKAILKLPIYFLYLLGLPVLPLLISISKTTAIVPKKLIYANRSTDFDFDVIRHVYGITQFNYIPNTTCVIFPEKVRSNNKAILKFSEDSSDYVIGLKYSAEAVYVYGSRILWLISFLGSSPKVEVKCLKGSNLPEAAGLPKVSLDFNDKKAFMKIIGK